MLREADRGSNKSQHSQAPDEVIFIKQIFVQKKRNALF